MKVGLRVWNNFPLENVNLVFDVDDEIFLHTRRAALKADSSDIAHFHGLGPENPNEDTLLVCIELKLPPLSSPRGIRSQ